MKQKMTIHRALAELKLIDSRIEKSIEEIQPTGLIRTGNKVNGFYTKEEFEKETKSKYQSVSDLIDRKNNIKSAIVKANSATLVEVNGVSMSIADAINFKRVIDVKKELINSIKRKHNAVKSTFISENEKVNKVALDNAKIMLGKQGDDRVKPTDEDVKNIVEPFVKRNRVELLNPLNVEKLIEELNQEVDGFEVEVDAVLSEANSLTQIEI